MKAYLCESNGATQVIMPSYVPTQVMMGRGSLQKLIDYVAQLAKARDAKRWALLYGGAAGKPWLGKPVSEIAGQCVAVFPNVSEASITALEPILQKIRGLDVDLVIGIGGGSVMDSAKVAAVGAATRGRIKDLLALPSSQIQRKPLVLAPTTAGSGSEVTPFATVWDMEIKRKFSLSAGNLYPDLSVIDPDALSSVPGIVTASCMFDAFCHALETALSINSDDESSDYALSSAAITVRNLGRLAEASVNVVHGEMALASVLAGAAIARGRTTLAHALSYPLTARYGIAHGRACGFFLPSVLRFNSLVTGEDCADPRGVEHVNGIFRRIYGVLGVGGRDEAMAKLQALRRRNGLSALPKGTRLDPEELAREVLSYDRIANNPRRVSHDDLVDIIADAVALSRRDAGEMQHAL